MNQSQALEISSNDIDRRLSALAEASNKPKPRKVDFSVVRIAYYFTAQPVPNRPIVVLPGACGFLPRHWKELTDPIRRKLLAKKPGLKLPARAAELSYQVLHRAIRKIAPSMGHNVATRAGLDLSQLTLHLARVFTGSPAGRGVGAYTNIITEQYCKLYELSQVYPEQFDAGRIQALQELARDRLVESGVDADDLAKAIKADGTVDEKLIDKMVGELTFKPTAEGDTYSNLDTQLAFISNPLDANLYASVASEGTDWPEFSDEAAKAKREELYAELKKSFDYALATDPTEANYNRRLQLTGAYYGPADALDFNAWMGQGSHAHLRTLLGLPSDQDEDDVVPAFDGQSR